MNRYSTIKLCNKIFNYTSYKCDLMLRSLVTQGRGHNYVTISNHVKFNLLIVPDAFTTLTIH